MDTWAQVRLRAQTFRTNICCSDDDGCTWGSLVVAAALAQTDLGLLPLGPDDPALDGARARLVDEWISVDRSLSLAAQNFAVAHEIGHFVLGHQHGAATNCGDGDVEALPDESSLSSTSKLATYNPRQRTEMEASVFAAELLAPQLLLRALIREGATLAQLVERLELPESAVINQLIAGVLTAEPPVEQAPGNEPVAAAVEAQPVTLDLSQDQAARWKGRALLVAAGPGTGKTRALSGRVQYLLREQHVPARSILVLTFSNKAAQELRDRLASAAGDAATGLTIETFHSFSLELLRRYSLRAGLRPDVRIIDTVDAYLMLDERIASLPLQHYAHPGEPGLYLPDLLRAVSRAKDELKTPRDYRRLAERQWDAAHKDAEQLAAAKAMEVADFYAYYDALLNSLTMVDYGDLLVKVVHLLEEYEDVRNELQAQYQHVLVDEYQDVNRASAYLLKLLASEGRGLWAVGDLRQSIYQFRGASPANVGQFEQDFREASRIHLARNYRSVAPLVGLFSDVANQILPDDPIAPWGSERGDLARAMRPAVRLFESSDGASEHAALAAALHDEHTAGRPFRDMAVLCRTNSQAEAIAQALKQCGVPVAYLGNLFTRPEVKELLSLLSLTEEGDGGDLFGLARLVDPSLHPEAAHTLVTNARLCGIPFPDALRRAGEIAGIAPDDAIQFQRLGELLATCFRDGDPAKGLARYLFSAPAHLQTLLRDGGIEAQLELVTLGELVLLARSFQVRKTAGVPGFGRLTFVDYARRLFQMGEGRIGLPPSLERVDAIRILTVHASKGLEFPVVAVPHLTKGRFPASSKGEPCPPPPGLLSAIPSADTSDEAFLFFVAISRARDVLVLSWSKRYLKREEKPSPFVDLVLPYCERLGVHPQRLGTAERANDSWMSGAAIVEPSLPAIKSDKPRHSAYAIEHYLRCPLQFYYQRVLLLDSGSQQNPQRRYTSVVSQTGEWLRNSIAAGVLPSWKATLSEFEDKWAAGGPVGSTYEQYYRQRAETMLRSLYDREQRDGAFQVWCHSLWVDLPHSVIRVDFDESKRTGSGLVLRRIRFGRRSDEHPREDRLSLYRLALSQYAADETARVELFYPLDNILIEVWPPQKRHEQARLNTFDSTAQMIASKRFLPSPGQHCSECAQLFICPKRPGASGAVESAVTANEASTQ
ncbi:MAG: UvrD-helicase domain-containing protein [Chloroflexi bacterium]|nr:UvrD-helicase domain-containing protein [Chloroflexota bacterium]